MWRPNVRRSLLVALALALASGGCADEDAEDFTESSDALKDADPGIRVLTYNVRHPGGLEGRDSWGERRAHVIKLIRANDPGIFGVQEARTLAGFSPSKDLIAAFTDPDEDSSKVYGVAVPTDPKGSAGARIPKLIFFRSARFENVSPPHPSVALPNPYATSDDCYGNAGDRTLAWTILRDKRSPEGKQHYFVANTHFAASRACFKARNKSAETVRAAIAEHNPKDYPVILVGDFNSDPHSPNPNEDDRSIATIRGAKGKSPLVPTSDYDTTTPKDQVTTTDSWPEDDGRGIARLDYIFVSKSLKTLRVDVDRGRYGHATTPSDHFAVTSTIARRR